MRWHSSVPTVDDRRPDTALDTFWAALVECRNDRDALLRVVAQQVVDVIGEGCVLTTVTPGGTFLHPAAVLHADPEVADAMRAVIGQHDQLIGEGLAGTVAADRRPLVLQDLSPQRITESTPERYRPFFRDHPMRSMMIVPLVAGGELVGTLGAFRTSLPTPYSPADLRRLEALAERAALAVADALPAPGRIEPSDYEALFRYSLDGFMLTAPDGVVLAANPEACTLLGRTEREILDLGRQGLLVPDDRLTAALAERAATGHARAELTMLRGDGTTFVADVSSTIFSTPDGRARACVIFRDITDQVAHREAAMSRLAELEEVADRDPLTGLLNRRGFAVAVDHALASADRHHTDSQLLFVDLDWLKALNDTKGHAVGDAAIVALGGAIQRAIREVDVACRLGGDEFVVLLAETEPGDVAAIVERIHDELGGDREAPPALTFSTGVVERPALAEATLAELIDAADRDMYQHKVLRRLRRR